MDSTIANGVLLGWLPGLSLQLGSTSHNKIVTSSFLSKRCSAKGRVYEDGVNESMSFSCPTGTVFSPLTSLWRRIWTENRGDTLQTRDCGVTERLSLVLKTKPRNYGICEDLRLDKRILVYLCSGEIAIAGMHLPRNQKKRGWRRSGGSQLVLEALLQSSSVCWPSIPSTGFVRI